MGSDAKAAYGAKGRGELLYFEPEKLTIITTDKTHPLYDERSDPTAPGYITDEMLQPMVESILLHGGVQKPVVVRKNGQHKDNSPNTELCDGRCRVRATMLANVIRKKKGQPPLVVPAVTKRADDVEFSGLKIALNAITRQDSPVVRGRAAARHMEMYGVSLEDVAKEFGVSVTQMKTDLALVDCDASVQRAVAQKELPAEAAKQLSKLPRAEQKATLEKLKASGETKGKKAVRAAAREVARGTGGEAPAPTLGKREILKIAARLAEVPMDGGYHPSLLASMVLRFVAGKDQEFLVQHPWYVTGTGKKPKAEHPR